MSQKFEDLNPTQMIDRLKQLDDAYYNDESIVSDEEYDYMYKYAKKVVPHHKYFTGVGSDVRGGKIDLPYQMGSLDQVEIGQIDNWIESNNLEMEALLITDKLDGTSAMIVYDDNGDLQIAYSRGNGVQGADITRHVRKINTVPKKVSGPMVVRGEMIISIPNWDYVKTMPIARSGSTYKNARNAMSGIMNAKENGDAVYEYVDFVAYEILGDDSSKEVMLMTLSSEGMLTPYYTSSTGRMLSDKTLAEYLVRRRNTSNYEIDGIVIDVNSTEKRKELNPTRDTLNPAYSIKYKVADATNQAIATVIEVEWNASKHGYLKPRVCIEPVDLVGVTVQHATGFNAKFIKDNGIGPGAKIRITRSGDVIPFIQDVITPTSPQMPDGEWEWNETEVDIILLENSREVVIEQIVDFFTSIDAPHLRKGNVVTLYEYGITTTEDIIKMSELQMFKILGENGKKIYTGLHDKLNLIPLSTLMGSTNFFGRGVGKRKMKSLIKQIGEQVYSGDTRPIAAADGFDQKTAEKIVGGMQKYLDWITPLEDSGLITIDYSECDAQSVTDSKVSGKTFVFTGFRSKPMQEEIEKQGGDVKGTVSSNTDFVVTTNVNSTSSKIKKARDLGISIINPQELEDMLNIK